jgi:hypothetical protein
MADPLQGRRHHHPHLPCEIWPVETTGSDDGSDMKLEISLLASPHYIELHMGCKVQTINLEQMNIEITKGLT